MMDLEKLIAEAWEQEGARHAISGVGSGQHELTLRTAFNNANGGPPIAEGSYGHCERHLSALCARAVIAKLKAIEPTSTMVDAYFGWAEKQDDRTDEENTAVIWGALLDALEQP